MEDLISTVAPVELAVLIIDMQNDYVHRDGASLRYFHASNDGREIVPADEPSASEHEAALSRLGRVFGQVFSAPEIISVWHSGAIVKPG